MHSNETKEKIREAIKQKWNDPKYRSAVINNPKMRRNLDWTGRRHSEASILKMRSVKLGKRLSDETKKKIGLSQIGRISPMLGKKHSPETKMKMSVKRKGRKPCLGKIAWNKGIPRTDEVKRKISEKYFLREIHNQNHNSLRGRFFSPKNNCEILYESSYELLAFKILEQLSEVKKYSRCNFVIPYFSESSTKKYMPDIIVTYMDGKSEVIEVKPQWALGRKDNILKIKAAKKYCAENDLTFSVWTENQLFAEA